MRGIKSVMMAVDLSDAANAVMEAGVLCSVKFSSRLILYHAAPNVVAEEQINEIKEHFEKRLNELYLKAGSHDTNCQVLIANESFPGGNLLSHMMTDVELFLIGSGKSGANNIKREKIIKIIDSFNQAVLVIPEKSALTKLEYILFCSSYDDLASNNPLDTLKYIATHFNAEVRVAHVKTHDGTPNEDHVERSRFEGAYFEPDVRYSYKLIRNSNVVDGIMNYIDHKKDNDMLVMIRRKHHIFDRLFGENFTFKMLQKTDIPLLILKESQLN